MSDEIRTEHKGLRFEHVVLGATLLLYGFTVIRRAAHLYALQVPGSPFALEVVDLARQGTFLACGLLYVVMLLLTLSSMSLPARWMSALWRNSPALVVVGFVAFSLPGFSVLDVALVLFAAWVGARMAAEVFLRKPPGRHPLDELMGVPARAGSMLVFSALALLLAGARAGLVDARDQKDFMVLRDRPNAVVLAMNDKTAVIGTIDRTSRQILPDRDFLPTPNGPLQVRWETIGPLTVRR